MATPEVRYGFLVNWFDPAGCITRKFQLFYFPVDKSVEMTDLKTRRLFLKRTKYDSISLQDLYVGGTVMIYSRQLRIVDYADEVTRLRLSSKDEKTVILVAPNGIPFLGSVFDAIHNTLNFQILKAKMVELSEHKAKQLHDKLSGIQEATLGLERLMCGRVVVLEVTGDNAVRKWRDFLGLTVAGDSADCQAVPPSLGGEKLASCCYGSESSVDVETDRELLLGRDLRTPAIFTGTTCCIIKPHAIQARQGGKIIAAILDGGFFITALELFQVELVHAEEFYEVYQGVVSEYMDMVRELASGPCIAMEISSNCEDTAKAFRDFTGPTDPEIARQLRPMSLRARYGKTRVQNAVHCTDLPEDTILELEYFFKLLQEKY